MEGPMSEIKEGDIWESRDRRNAGKRVTIVMLEGDSVLAEDTTGKRTRIKIHRLLYSRHYRRVASPVSESQAKAVLDAEREVSRQRAVDQLDGE
jgi:hypothetical protein